jgi:hypothetical protein
MYIHGFLCACIFDDSAPLHDSKQLWWGNGVGVFVPPPLVGAIVHPQLLFLPLQQFSTSRCLLLADQGDILPQQRLLPHEDCGHS